MGTRAVVHVDLMPFHIGKNIFIATHWDGDALGKKLKAKIAEETEGLKKKDIEFGMALQRAVWKAAADHSIDFSTTDGKQSFDKLYDDWAEYEYVVNPDGTIKVRERTGSWRENRTGNWKRLEEVL